MGILQDTPRTSDGKQITLNSAFPGNVSIAFPGAADASGRWDGAPFRYECMNAVPGTYEALVWGFNEWIYMAGGEVRYAGAAFGDEITFLIHAPATVLTVGTGYGLAPTGLGFNIVTPGATHSIDLANDAVPVPNASGLGFFDWDSDTNTITLNPSRTGNYDLYDVEIPLSKYLPRTQVWGGTEAAPMVSNFVIPAVKPKRILPQWKCRLSYTSATDKSVNPFRMVWDLFVGRLKTT